MKLVAPLDPAIDTSAEMPEPGPSVGREFEGVYEEVCAARSKLEKLLLTPEDQKYHQEVMDYITKSGYGLHAEVCWSALSMMRRGYDIRESLAYGLSEWDL